jgi:hypothetical protein
MPTCHGTYSHCVTYVNVVSDFCMVTLHACRSLSSIDRPIHHHFVHKSMCMRLGVCWRSSVPRRCFIRDSLCQARDTRVPWVAHLL